MEPTVDAIVLHPAILIASGFESISSRQVRFLNAHRSHFYAKVVDMTKTLVISRPDFELGGIMNPFGNFLDTEKAYKQVGQVISNFPYLTMKEIFVHVYRKDMNLIWQELMIELFQDLSQLCIEQKRPREFFRANTSIIHALSPYPIYQKITALHACGLGDKLQNTFDYVFRRFVTYEQTIDEPVIVKK